MKSFLLAVQFLTIFPVKIKEQLKPTDFCGVLLFFPFIGFMLGICLVCALFLSGGLPVYVSTILILILGVIFTGGLHLDGFADTCDGLYGGNSMEKTLQIMRDSHIGVMGVIGLVCLLLLKFALMLSIPSWQLWKALINMMIFSRWAQVFACYSTRYPHEQGKAKVFIENVCFTDLFIGGAFVVCMFIFFWQLKGIAVFIMMFALIALFKKYIKTRIDGMTGDTIGATSEIAEAGVLFCAVCFLGG